MGSCTIKFDGNEFNYEEFATKLHDGLLQELVDSKAVNINKFKGEIPGYIKIKPLSVFEQQEPIKEKPVEKKPTESKQEVKGELSDIELKYKNDPDSLTRDELKDVLEIKRKRLRKAIDSWSNRNLTKLEIEIKKKGIAILEKTEEDLIKRIDAGVNQKIASRNQAAEMASQVISNQDPVRSKKSISTLESLYPEDSQKGKVIAAVKKSIAVLKSAFPFMDIIVHQTQEEFYAAIGERQMPGVQTNGTFAYSKSIISGAITGGKIHINLATAKPSTVFHEVAHALMLKAFNDNISLYNNFRRSVSKILSSSVDNYLKSFSSQYDEDMSSEEYLVELVALLANTEKSIEPSILLKLKSLINDLVSKLTGGKIKVFEESAIGLEVYQFLKEMAIIIKQGEDIKNLNSDFAASLFEPASLNLAGVVPNNIPSSDRKPLVKESRGDYEMVDHPIVSKNILKGKAIAVTMSDHTKVGVYRNPKSGVEYHGLMGGVFYPYIKAIREAGLGWASVTTKAARSLVLNALNTEYTVVYRMARATGSQGNINFGDISFLELTAPVTNKKVSEKEFLEKLNNKLKEVKAGIKFLEKYGVNGKIASISDLKKSLASMSFSARGGFWKVTMKGSWTKKSVGEWYKFLEKYEVASLEDIVNGLAEEETDSALDHDVVAVLKIAKPEYTENGLIKIYTTRKNLVNEKKGVFFIDAPDHPSYPYVVKGEPVGVLDEFNSIVEYFPIIASWIKSGRLNSPYKAVETMGKELISTKLQQLESEKESLKSDLKAIEKSRKEKAQILGFSAIESEEQIRERVKNDKEYFGKLVRYAIVSIELGLVKSMNQLREAFKKDLGMDFTKALNKELGLIYNTAKESATTTKKKTIKQTIKSATEVKTDKSIKISFAEFMDTIYKSENKGYKTKKELIKFALAYLKSQNISVLAMPKILQLIDRAIELKSLDKFDASFADYVDYYVSQASRLAKVAESEEVANKLKKKISAEKLGQITPQAIRLANLQLDLLTDSELDLFISLAKDLLTPKIAEVKNLKIGLEELVMAERAAIENGIENNLFSDKELISLIDKLHVLNEEAQSPELTDAEKIAKSKRFAAQQGKLITLLQVKRSIIMSYIDSYSDKITDIKSYVKLSNSIKQYNNLLAALNNMGGISDVELDELSIRMSNKNLTLLEQSLKDRLDEFKSELVRDIKQLSKAARSEFAQGTMRDKLFSFMSAFDKALYTPILLGILDEKATNILEKMDIADLDLYQRGLEQLLNGYISPSLREINEVINATYVREDMDAHIDNYVENESKFTSAWNRFSEKWVKSIKDFNTEEEVVEFLKTKNWQSIKDRLAESGLASVYEKYIYPVIATSFTPYLKARKDITERVTIASDKVKKDIHKVVLGIFATQLDLTRHEKWNGEILADTILQKYEDKELNSVSKKRIADLKEARALIKGDISTRDGLLKAMDTFFSENKNAKVLYNEIRSAIDNKVFEMTKMNIEREGGYVEFDSEYFPIQRVGLGEYKSQSYADLFNAATKSKNISTRSNATFKRIGDPLVMREFDIVKAFDNMVDDVAKNYYLRPVIVPLERSITSLANKYGDKKSDFYDKDIAVFLRGIRGFVHTNLSLELSRQEYNVVANVVSKGTGYTRNLYLANLFARAKDFVANIALISTSRNPLTMFKYLGKQEVELSKDDFAVLAELTNSPIIFNKSIKDIEDQYSVSVTASKKKLDSIASMADVPVKRKYWKALFLLEFKKATGGNFDSKLFKADYVSYYLENKEVIDKVARLADYEVDKKFSAQLPSGQALVFSILPAIPFLKFKGLEFQKKSPTASVVKYMTTYVAWGSDVALNATYRLFRSGDVKGFAKDVTPLVASATMFTVSGFYAKALGATLAYGSKALFASLLSSLVGEDDDDKDKQSVMDYAKEQLAWANSHIYTADGVNWDEVEAAYIDLAITLGTSKYATGIKDGLGFVLSVVGSADVEFSSDKATEKEAVERWVDINNYYRAGFKSGIPFVSRNRKLPSKAADAFALIPVVGSYNNILGNVLNEKDESSLTSLAKGVMDNDLEKVALGVGQLGTLVLTGVGLSWAPTGYALVTAEAKLQATKDMEKFRKESKAGKGKSSKPSNPFGSPGLGGGLGGPKGF